MKTLFVKYGVWVSGGHALLDDELVEKSEIIEIENLLDLNLRYKHIIDVKILLNGNKSIHTTEEPFSDERSK